MANFFDKIPASLFTATLGDDLIYHAPGGDVAIRGFVNDYIDPIFSGDAHISESRKRIDAAIADTPGIKRGMKFTHDGIQYTVEDVVHNDGQFAGWVVR